MGTWPTDGILRPACTVVDACNETDECLCNLLMDDGGRGLPRLIDWSGEQSAALDALQRGERDCWDSDLNYCGAAAFNGRIKVYSLLDETYSSVILTRVPFA